jgi:hypothetical protein
MLREVVESRYSAVIREQLRDIIGHSVLIRVIVGAYVPEPAVIAPEPTPAVIPPIDSAITSVIPIITDKMLAALNIQVDDSPPADVPVADVPVADVPVADVPVMSADDAIDVPVTRSSEVATVTPSTTPLVAPPVVIQPQLPLDSPKPKLTFGSLSPTTADDDAPTQSDFFTTATRGMLNQRFTF